MMNAVEVRNAFKYYGSAKEPKIVLDHVNLTVKYGTLYGLLGPSGCGKTTLLSCVVGVMKMHEGSINVLGGAPGSQKSGVPGPRVGYMPQEIALVPTSTIKETIYYYGRIYGMEIEEIRDSYEKLMKLFELPDGDRYIIDCSGGQQRCVSLGAAIVHNPELLILDEPTVGLDPLLRDKMWKFLVSTARNSNTAIIITTHYIEEARQADWVGIMREGKILAEDTPYSILENLEVSSLEDGFLKLCTKHEALSQSNKTVSVYNYKTVNSSGTSKSAEEEIVKKWDKPQRKSSSRQKIRGLFTRNILSIFREPASWFVFFVFPWFQVVCFYAALGGDPKGLKLGIVSDEIRDYSECYNDSLITAFSHDLECDLHKISCRFITELQDDVAIKYFYDTFDEAYQEVKKGHLTGFVYFASNFTESTIEVRDEREDSDEGSIVNREIQVYLDETNNQISLFLKRKLFRTFQHYSENLMTDCDIKKRLGRSPIVFDEPIGGSNDDEFNLFMAPGMAITMLYTLATLLTCMLFVLDHVEGTWNRSIVSGISVTELYITHMIMNSIFVTIVAVQVVGTIIIAFDIDNKGSNFTVLLLIGLQAFSGIMCGAFLSTLIDTVRAASMATSGLIVTILLLSGTVWPVEGMPDILRQFSYALPFTLPIIAVRGIIFKGLTIMHLSVYGAFLVTIAYMVGFFVLSIVALKLKK